MLVFCENFVLLHLIFTFAKVQKIFQIVAMLLLYASEAFFELAVFNMTRYDV